MKDHPDFSKWYSVYKPVFASMQWALLEADVGAQMREHTVLTRMEIKRIVAMARHPITGTL